MSLFLNCLFICLLFSDYWGKGTKWSVSFVVLSGWMIGDICAASIIDEL